jgi:NADH:ubiquinone oxidoreductase subunit K
LIASLHTSEPTFLSLTILYLTIGIELDDITGSISTLSILTIAAAESAICSALIVISHRIKGEINSRAFNSSYG